MLNHPKNIYSNSTARSPTFAIPPRPELDVDILPTTHILLAVGDLKVRALSANSIWNSTNSVRDTQAAGRFLPTEAIACYFPKAHIENIKN